MRVFELTPPPPSSPFPQRDGSSLYMTLHCHKVDDSTLIKDGQKPVHVPVGWQIAAGDADDIRVCGAHPWQSYALIFTNGDRYNTAMADPSDRGTCAQAVLNI